MTQTAVEWYRHNFFKALEEGLLFTESEIFEQANKMFEEQIIESYNKGEFNDGMNETAEEYFNNTYNQ